jgi:hypothetical protein
MSDYICPNCRGGFPEGPLDNGCCPWCEQPLNGSYEPPEQPTLVSRTETKDDYDGEYGVLGRLFGWEPDND